MITINRRSVVLYQTNGGLCIELKESGVIQGNLCPINPETVSIITRAWLIYEVNINQIIEDDTI